MLSAKDKGKAFANLVHCLEKSSPWAEIAVSQYTGSVCVQELTAVPMGEHNLGVNTMVETRGLTIHLVADSSMSVYGNYICIYMCVYVSTNLM